VLYEDEETYMLMLIVNSYFFRYLFKTDFEDEFCFLPRTKFNKCDVFSQKKMS